MQAIFEYQTMICALTGMDVSNASHYDGATAMAEAVIMATSASRGRRRRVVMAPTVHPEYRDTVRTYTQGMDIEIIGDQDLAAAHPADLLALVDEQVSCLIVQNPDFLGRIHDLAGIADAVHEHGALLVVACDPISLGLLQPPGAFGADIALGDGQSLGIPLNYGGPYLGFFACREEHLRRMAGRLVGETVDGQGRRGYVLTLSTPSNISAVSGPPPTSALIKGSMPWPPRSIWRRWASAACRNWPSSVTSAPITPRGPSMSCRPIRWT
jgi:glycine dehydrogenase subunit 1